MFISFVEKEVTYGRVWLMREGARHRSIPRFAVALNTKVSIDLSRMVTFSSFTLTTMFSFSEEEVPRRARLWLMREVQEVTPLRSRYAISLHC